jgi:DNA-binding transcriptional MerR regulator
MPAARQRVKSAAAFRTISEVSTDLEVPQHVLRFWESKFTPVRPLKRGGGRRYYRPEDVDLLRRIRNLLYTDGYTIKGVQRLLREGHGKLVLEAAPSNAPVAPVAPDGDRATLENVLTDLVEIRNLLRNVKKN